MTFTANVKNELCTLETRPIEILSELSAIIRNSYKDQTIIKIITENILVAERIYRLINLEYNISPQIIVRKGYNYNKNYLYILEIKEVDMICRDLNIEEVPKEYLVADEEQIKAYLRGLFLIKGSVNDPQKSRYHLELSVDKEDYARFVLKILSQYNINAKVIARDNNYMIYLKEAEKISDFLKLIGASKAVLYFEDIRIYRDHANMVNRLNNCEQANVDKIINTSYEQIKAIEKIEKNVGLDILNEGEKVVALYRKKYSEVSLVELSEIITLETGHKITKSGVYHRLNKIKEIADKIGNNN
ncbi:MAG: DNA-binding protein WhiA [Erysipelotrichaceae bacterium]|nr:DNA-binding protein WhiA [Erysipelotrichaceae bacterium]